MNNLLSAAGMVFGYTQDGRSFIKPSQTVTGNDFDELTNKTGTLLLKGLLCEDLTERNLYGAVMSVYVINPAYEAVLDDEEWDDLFYIGDLTEEEVMNVITISP